MAEVNAIMAFRGRSGSSHLAKLINGHPDISFDLEIFDNKARDRMVEEHGLEYMLKHYRGILDEVLSRLGRVSGFKMQYNQFKCFPEASEMIIERADQFRCVFIYRKNQLKGAISVQNYMRVKELTGRANLKASKEYPEELKQPLIVDVQRLKKDIRVREESDTVYYEAMAKHMPVHVIVYEDMLIDEQKVMDGCYRFLGVEPIELPKPELQKITPDDLRDAIGNYDEVVESLKGTPFEGYIDDSYSFTLPTDKYQKAA